MNFQTLPQVFKSSKYLDMAFKEAGKQAGKGSRKIKQAEQKKCRTRIRSAEQNLTGHLRAVVEQYPRTEELPEFYKELMMLTLDVSELKKALSSVNWAERKIRELTATYIRSDKPDAWKAFYGRISSILKRIDKHLKVIESARRVMKSYPDIKQEYTVCLVGFPNVGKSTVLSRITSAKPEIKPYAFTTKGLNIGYFEHYFHLVQIIDTPGTLDRLEKMNNIEKQAYLAIKHCANLLVFVYDPTYDHEKQMILKSKISLMGKQVILYVTKTDLKQPKHLDKKDYINNPALLKETIGAILKEQLTRHPLTTDGNAHT